METRKNNIQRNDTILLSSTLERSTWNDCWGVRENVILQDHNKQLWSLNWSIKIWKKSGVASVSRWSKLYFFCFISVTCQKLQGHPCCRHPNTVHCLFNFSIKGEWEKKHLIKFHEHTWIFSTNSGTTSLFSKECSFWSKWDLEVLLFHPDKASCASKGASTTSHILAQRAREKRKNAEPRALVCIQRKGGCVRVSTDSTLTISICYKSLDRCSYTGVIRWIVSREMLGRKSNIKVKMGRSWKF